MSAPRMSNQTASILELLLGSPETPWYGLDISKASGLKTGTVYPVLVRLESQGWLESQWEPGDASELGRPLRRMYRLTGIGEMSAPSAIEQHRAKSDKREASELLGRRGRITRPETGMA